MRRPIQSCENVCSKHTRLMAEQRGSESHRMRWTKSTRTSRSTYGNERNLRKRAAAATIAAGGNAGGAAEETA